MGKNKSKVALLTLLVCILAILLYQGKDRIKLPNSLNQKSFKIKAVEKSQIKHFAELSETEGSLAHQITHFFDIEASDLKKIDKTFYKDWKKNRWVKREGNFDKEPAFKRDLIFLPTLHLEERVTEGYEFVLPEIIANDVKFSVNKGVQLPKNAAFNLGGNHTLFDIDLSQKLAGQHEAKLVYTLYKIRTSPTNDSMESIIFFIIADEKGAVLRTKEVSYPLADKNMGIAKIQNWTKAQLELSKESLIREFFKDKTSHISEFSNDFFQFEDSNMDGECNSTKLGRWEKAEIERHSTKLSTLTFDLLVLPVQERDPRNDRVGRVLSSRLIAQEIEQQTGLKVMSPEMVQRLLGSNQILFDLKSVNDLATEFSARVVHLFKRKKQMKLGRHEPETELAAVLTDNTGKIIKDVFYSIGKEDTYERRNQTYKKGGQLPLATELQDTLEVQIARIQSELVSSLFNSQISPESDKQISPATELNFPESLADIPQLAETPLENAAYLQLLAILTPELLDYERKRLFERSLIALQKADNNSKYQNLLKARALFHLYRRPFALPYLEEASLPAELAFKEYLHGNLSGLEELTNTIKNPLLHSMATIELHQLNYIYTRPRITREAFKVPNSTWFALIESTTHDRDTWYTPENLSFFIEIKGLFPDFDTLLEKALHGSAVVDNDLSFHKNTQILNGIFSLPGGPASLDLDYQYGAEITDGDIWNLYRSLFIANMLRDLKISVKVHGSYDTAIEKAESYEEILEGHPVFHALYAEALVAKAKKLPRNEYRQYMEKAFTINDQVFYNTCGVTRATLNAEYLVTGPLKPFLPKNRYIKTPKFYGAALDMRYYPTSLFQPSYNCRLISLPFSNARIDSLQILAEKEEDDFVLQELSYRFNGHPEKASLQASLYSAKGDDKTAKEILNDAIANGDQSWETYNALAKIYMEKEEYTKARDKLLEYPAFIKPATDKRVRTSNEANYVGKEFLRFGQFEEAKPFFEIAASMMTGAGSQYHSTQVLALFEQNYAKLLEYSQQQARRYKNIAAYTTFLSFLHVLGFHDDSEAAFQLLAKRKNFKNIWTSQLIGHRILKRDLQEVIDNFKADHNLAEKNQELNQHIATLMIVDRIADQDKINLLESIELKKNITLKNDHFQEKLNESLAQGILPFFKEQISSENQVLSGSYSYFTRLDTLIKEGKYDEAIILNLQFIKMKGEPNPEYTPDKYLPPNMPESLKPAKFNYDNDPTPMYTLPYLAMAVTKSNVGEQAKNDFQSQFSSIRNNPWYKYRLFDFHLSEAILNAYSEKKEESIQSLKKAFAYEYTREERELFRPYPRRYQILQICEWLYKEHNDERFLKLALDWAKRIQKITPQHSWAYSFMALYESDMEEKTRSAAHALYLDPQSYWLSLVDEKIKKEAKDWWKTNNPFVIIQEEKEKTEGI